MTHRCMHEGVSLAALAQWAERLMALGLLDRGRYDALRQELDTAQRGRLDQPPEPLLTVLLFGASGVGKSQLLNALAGEVIATSHFLRPTTHLPTAYAHADVQAERLFEYGVTFGSLARLPATFRRHTREELRHMVIVDAPDIDSHVLEHRDQVRQLLAVVDVVLYVVTPESYKNDCGWQTVLNERGRRAFAFVMNKWDREGKRPVSPGQADVDADFLAMLRQRGGYAEPLLFRVSAATWVARHQEPATAPPLAAGEQFPELQRWLLGELSGSRIARIQGQRRRALWGRLAAAVSAAQPVAVGEGGWEEAVCGALAGLRTDGWQMLQPCIDAHARQLAQAYSIDAWPRSPGPFGLCLRGIAAVSALLGGMATRFAAVSRSISQPGQLLLPAGTSDLGTAGIPKRLGLHTEECLHSLEVQALQHGVPVQWLSEQWQGLVATVPVRLSAAVELGASTRITGPWSRGRVVLGRIVLVLLELLLTLFFGLVLWRLATSFLAAVYLSVGFVTHALALFGGIVLLGYLALSWCFPRPEILLRRQLTARLGAVWDGIIADLEQHTREYLAEIRTLHQQGQAFIEALHGEIALTAPHPDGPTAAPDPHADRLFAAAEQA